MISYSYKLASGLHLKRVTADENGAEIEGMDMRQLIVIIAAVITLSDGLKETCNWLCDLQGKEWTGKCTVEIDYKLTCICKEDK